MSASVSETFPLPSAQGLEVDFLENRSSRVEEYISGCKFNSVKQEFTAKPNSGMLAFSNGSGTESQTRLKHTHNSLLAAIQALKENKGSDNAQVALFDISQSRTWEDVIAAVKAAEQEYLKDESPTGRIRKAFRRVEDNASSILPFVGMLPDGEYKTLCGGLTLVLKSMMRKAERRKKMAELLERFPLFIQDTEDYIHIYPQASKLTSCVEWLYIEIIGAIEEMIRWYLEKPIKRSFKSVLANDAYGEKLTKRISDIDVAHAAFKGETEKLLHWRAKFISQNGVMTMMNTQQISIDLRSVDVKVDELQKTQHTIEQEISLFGSKIANNIATVLQDLQKNARWLQEREECIQKLQSQEAQIKDLEKQLHDKTIRGSTLAKRLHISLPSDSHLEDAKLALSEGLTQRVRYQSKAKHIAETEEFKNWFASEGSGILCVDGNSEQDSFSPTAFLASLLVNKMSSSLSNEVLILPFFCGLHTSVVELDKHTIRGPILLLRTLVAQILSLDDIDTRRHLKFLNDDHVQAMARMDFKSYLITLRELIISLIHDYKGVLIVIDSVEFYDREKYQVEIKRIMKFLANTTNEISSGQGVLKVLIMASSHSRIFRRFKGVDVLDVLEEVECDGEGYESF